MFDYSILPLQHRAETAVPALAQADLAPGACDAAFKADIALLSIGYAF